MSELYSIVRGKAGKQTECAQHAGNGEVRPTRNFGLQYAETGERMVNDTFTVSEDMNTEVTKVERNYRFDEVWTTGKANGYRQPEIRTFLSV